jgi:hypothetical protein
MGEESLLGNADFVACVRLLRDLHAAIREGTDESEAGERIRDEMDGPGSRLSPDEIASVQGISADFYSLMDPPTGPVLTRTAEVDDDLAESESARASSRFHQALDLLRKRAGFLTPAALAFARGRIWMEAGESDIASLFFERARELDPENPAYRPVALAR